MGIENVVKVLYFVGLPSTRERDEIERQYLADEIGTCEFEEKVEAYLEKVKT